MISIAYLKTRFNILCKLSLNTIGVSSAQKEEILNVSKLLKVKFDNICSTFLRMFDDTQADQMVLVTFLTCKVDYTIYKPYAWHLCG